MPHAPLVLFQQNMGLLPGPFYKGADLDASVSGLIDGVLRICPDVVGLSECFNNAARREIIDGLEDLYPYHEAGPVEPGLDQDGGLLLLSRHELIASTSSIYRAYEAEDGLTDKGILHMRIRPTGFSTSVDVFLTHLQNPTPDFGSHPQAQAAIEAQLRHLRTFVAACGHVGRPSLVMGDLNVNGFDAPLYEQMMELLGRPVDAWFQASSRTFGGRGGDWSGVTLDSVRSFKEDQPPTPMDDERRGRGGQRLDYVLDWSDQRRWRSAFGAADVVLLEASAGRTVSDHYGLTMELMEATSHPVPRIGRPLRRVRLRLGGFHCLKETGELGSDEVVFELRAEAQNGEFEGPEGEVGPVVMARVDSVVSGRVHTWQDAPALELRGDPGDHVDIVVSGVEEDLFVDDQLGVRKLRLNRADLLWLRHCAASGEDPEVTPRLLRGAGGEYGVSVVVEVD